MPKFSKEEKLVIQKRLSEAGRNLFSQHGLKKVTVDDLVNSANIAKGSFYAFYENKEQLFMELNMEEQEKIFNEIEKEIQIEIQNYGSKEYGNKEPKRLTSYVLKLVLKRFIHNPILTQINEETFDYLKRKLPADRMEQHLSDDALTLKKLELYGVEFSYPLTIAAKSLHPIFAYANKIKADPDYESIITILIDGVVSKIVKE